MRTLGTSFVTGNRLFAPVSGAGSGTLPPVVAETLPSASTFLPAAPAETTASTSGAKKGLMKHATHLVDLVLDIVPGTEEGTLPEFDHFSSLIGQLFTHIEAKEIDAVNEKFDGSPSLAMGFDAEGRPYVAYKYGIGRAEGQKIMRTVREAREMFGDTALGEIFADCVRLLRTRIARFGKKTKELVFQADLLFTPSNGAKTVTGDAVIIRANPFGITYTLSKGSKFYESARDADIGLVVHTVKRSVIDPETGVIKDPEPHDNPDDIEEFVTMLRTEKIFAIDPWSRRVSIDRGEAPFSREKREEIERIVHKMHTGLSHLSKEFRTKWSPFLPHFKIFLNSSLKPGRSGGLYRAAAADEPFNFDYLAEEFQAWLTMRSEQISITSSGSTSPRAPKKKPGEFAALMAAHREELHAYFRAYYDANRIQYFLKPHMQEVYRSKLGGGPIEGIMIIDDVIAVKLVNRLTFTMDNFSGEPARRQMKRLQSAHALKKKPAKNIPTPKVLRAWHAGSAFFIGKLQPPHAGHIALIGAAIVQLGADHVFVIPSSKEPNPYAESWQELGVADTKKELVAGNYRHVFSQKLREEILRSGLAAGVRIEPMDSRAFWSHLKHAQDNNRRGQVALIMGQKEIDAGRYQEQLARFGSHLRALPIAMQEGGISGTSVRRAIKSLHEHGDIASYEFLVRAFAFIPKVKDRNRIIGQLLYEWKLVENAVARLI